MFHVPAASLNGVNLIDSTVEEEEFCQCVPIKSILSRSDKGVGLAGQKIRIGGWVKSGRVAGKGTFAFLEVNDGSCPSNLQVKLKAEVYKLRDVVATGTSVHVEGLLQLPPEDSKQSIEMEVEKVIDVGTVINAAKYPLPKGKPSKLSLESIRDIVHLRPRTTVDVMKCAEAYVKFLCEWLLDHCYDDMEVMTKAIDPTAIQRLQMVFNSKFHRVTYTEAIAILEEASTEVKKFENKVEWGIDLASEHERYLTEEKFKAPVIVYNYPKAIKAFYMKLNEDNTTVAAMDVLVPKVGELLDGSQREDNYEVLKQRILEMGLPLDPYEWYLELRAYGTVKHGGFGLGFERMILFATGVDNIRDVIPFPRYPGRADL